MQLQIVDANSALISSATVRIKQSGKLIKEFTGEVQSPIVFSKLETGKYILEVEAGGFQPKSQEIELRAGANQLTIQLDILEISETVNIEQSKQEKAVDNAFNSFLTKEQIADLPDDPEEMKRVLRQIAGDPAAEIRVDGFTSNSLPPKSQISSIRISRSSFDAENHKLGTTYIDITTKVANPRFNGSLLLTFNDEALNARNFFSPTRFAEQSKNTVFSLNGPIKKDKASFSFTLIDFRNLEGDSVNAFLPDGRLRDSVNRSTGYTRLSPRINFNLPKDHTAKLSYEYDNSNAENLGVGGFNLPSRGFDSAFQSHQLRFSESGFIGKSFLNELRFQFRYENSQADPQSEDAAVLVLDSFNSGGAGNFRKSSRHSLLLADNLLFGYKNHALKIGALVEFEKLAELKESNKNGTFIFSNLDDFAAGRPSIFTQNPASKIVNLSQVQIGTFIQDDFKLSKNFGVSLGVRYEAQSNLRDNNNFSPRVGFTWSPFKNGKTTFRGGFGIFYNWLETGHLAAVLSRDFFQPGEIIILNPEFPNPFLSGQSQVLPRSFWQKADGLKTPNIYHTSFSAENRFSKNLILRAVYVYEKGINQFRSRDINAPVAGTRPDPSFGKITQVESSAFFVRNSLNIGLSGTLLKKLTFYADYHLSKITSDNNGIFGLPGDNYNLRAERAPADNDQRHRFSTSVIWDIRKGLRLSGIYFANSPLPYTITTGRDDNGDTNFNDRPFGVLRNSERGTWKNRLDMSFSWAFSFIDRKKADGRDFSILTTSSESGFDFTDPEKRFSLKFFVNAENILNQANFNNFVGVQTSPLFHQPISSEKARRIILGVRFNF
ncbi:MAG TPA: TonB-dependent receptor [Pyrinomonadaceae bacterium]|nr:TonB-dependent receptor [Pyrinomonadaceae bacterium]